MTTKKKAPVYADIVQNDPRMEERPLYEIDKAGLYWVKWGNGPTWEFCLIFKNGELWYVQELSGSRRTLPVNRVAALVAGPVALVP